jgi:phosphatidylserine decarboxylase
MDKASQRISTCLTGSCRPIIRHYRIRPACRTFVASRAQRNQQPREPFRTRLGTALRNTRIQWYTIPVGAGIAFLGAMQLFKISERERARLEEEREAAYSENGDQEPKKPIKRKRIRPSGPWYD